MVHLMVEDSKTPHNPMGWQLVTEEDAEILAEVLRSEGRQFAILN